MTHLKMDMDHRVAVMVADMVETVVVMVDHLPAVVEDMTKVYYHIRFYLIQIDLVPMLNGQPITSLPGMERLHPEVLEAIGKGPVGRTVFVRNLAYTVDEQKCREVFGMAGTIQSVDLVSDRETGKTKGFGTITFAQVNIIFICVLV